MPKILIIDDEQQNVELLQSYLRFFRFDTREAYSGHDGFELALSYQPDLILTDLRMPLDTWDGYKTISELKTHSNTCHIPIIAMTAAGSPIEAKQVGCDEVLIRPFRTNQLKQILDRYIAIA